MSRKIALSTDAGTVKDAQVIKIARNGLVKNCERILVACGGVARQVWPIEESINTPDPRIIWDEYESLQAVSVAQDPSSAVALFLFDPATGIVNISEYPPPSGIVQQPYLDPPPAAIGEYVVMIDNIDTASIGSGSFDAFDGSGVWTRIDPLDTAPQYSLVLSAIGVSEVTADIHIAPEDGAGNPILALSETVQCSWYAEVTEGGAEDSDIIMTAVPWSVEELKVNEDADCSVTVSPLGTIEAEGDTSGSFSESWVVTPANTETVTVTLISGTAPAGPALATPHTINQYLVWTLTADDPDEDITCVIDVLIDNGDTSATKRITMHSQRTETTNNEVVWTEDSAAIVDIGVDTAARVTLTARDTGVVNGVGLTSGESTPFPIDWHDLAPAAANGEEYEVRLVVDSGDDPDTGPALNTWHLMSEDREWIWDLPTPAPPVAALIATTTLSFRPAGQPSNAVDKSITINVNTEQGL